MSDTALTNDPSLSAAELPSAPLEAHATLTPPAARFMVKFDTAVAKKLGLSGDLDASAKHLFVKAIAITGNPLKPSRSANLIVDAGDKGMRHVQLGMPVSLSVAARQLAKPPIDDELGVALLPVAGNTSLPMVDLTAKGLKNPELIRAAIRQALPARNSKTTGLHRPIPGPRPGQP
jgi:hypothetical protein